MTAANGQIEESAIAAASEIPTDVPLGAKIARSIMFGALRYVLLIPIPFIMTPFILHKIGVAGYGTWAVFLAINSLTSLADLGLVGTLSKFVAEHYAHRDFAALSRLLSSALTLFLLLGLAAAAVVGGGTQLLTRALFRGSSVSQPELMFLLRCFLVVIVANILVLLLSSITSGLQRLDITYIMSAANILLSAIGGGLLLVQGWGLRGLIYAYAGSAVLTLLGYAVIVRNLLPQVRVNPFHFEVAEARRMLGFSLRLYVIQASLSIHSQVDKVLLALLMGVTPVGWFDIASDVALKIRGVIGLILAPVLPAASELNALRDEPRTKELYYRTHKYLALLGIPFVVCTNVFAARFIELWLGPGMTMIALPLSLLVTSFFFNLASGPGFLIFAGRGHLKPAIRSCMLGIVLNVIASFGLIYTLGFAGAAIGTSVSISVAAIYLTWMFHHETGYRFGRLLRESYLKPAFSSILVIAPLIAMYPPKSLPWAGLVAIGLAFGALYSLVILLSRFFDEYDWTKIESFLPAMRHARRIGWIG
jgi:O-antigen/teichoic acid export membrane protein